MSKNNTVTRRQFLDVTGKAAVMVAAIPMLTQNASADEKSARTWTSHSGQTIEAEFVKIQYGKVYLKKPDGKVITIRLTQLSPEDQKIASELGATSPKRLKSETEVKKKHDFGSYCGLYCGACKPAIRSAKARDRKQAGCFGCKGKKAPKYAKSCKVRKCARRKKLESCGECKDYPCEILVEFFGHGKPRYELRKKYLEKIHGAGYEKWLTEQEKRWSCPKCGIAFGYEDRVCGKCGADLYSIQEEYEDYKKVAVK